MKKNYSTYKKTYITLAFLCITYFGYSQKTLTNTISGSFIAPAKATYSIVESGSAKKIPSPFTLTTHLTTISNLGGEMAIPFNF